MLYKMKTDTDNISKVDELREKFLKIYEDHGVDLFGTWEEKDNPSVSYYITRYKDENDYKEKVAKLQKDERYAELTSQLNEIRVDNSSTRLIPKW